MKIILSMALVFTICTCSAQERLSPGCYEAKNNNLLIDLDVKLNEDSSYVFNEFGDMYNSTSNGKWIVKGNYLILHSSIQPKIKGHIIESHDSATDKIELLLFDIYGKPLRNVSHVYIRQSSDYLALSDQKNNDFYIPRHKLQNIFFVGVGSTYKETEVRLRKSDSNKIEIYLVPDTRGLFQTNKRYLIKDSSSFSRGIFIFKKIDCKDR